MRRQATAGTKKRPEDRRKRKTKAAIYAAFHELIAEKDFNKITVTELAERADIDRKTFYLHYESIDALADELLYQQMEDAVEVLSAVPTDENGRIDVPTLLRAMIEEFTKNIEMNAALAEHADMNELIKHIEPMLTACIAENDLLGLAEDLGPYLDLFVAFFCGGLLSLCRQWMVEDKDLPLDMVSALAGTAVGGSTASVSEAARAIRYKQKQSASEGQS